MLKIDIAKLKENIRTATVFSLPEMNAGTLYLYEMLFKRMARGEEVRLSELDCNSFELDDMDAMRKLFDEILYPNENRVDCISSVLRGISPVSAAAFV